MSFSNQIDPIGQNRGGTWDWNRSFYHFSLEDDKVNIKIVKLNILERIFRKIFCFCNFETVLKQSAWNHIQKYSAQYKEPLFKEIEAIAKTQGFSAVQFFIDKNK